MNLSNRKRKKLLKLLRKELITYNRANNNKDFKRINLDKELVQELLQDLVYLSFDKSNFNLLQIIDLEDISFEDIDVEYASFENTNANIDPQTVKNKSLLGTNLKGLDMRGKRFDDVLLIQTNLTNTKFKFSPQTIKNKCLWGTILEGLDLFDKDFTDVDIRYASFSNTNAYIDPQKIMNKDLTGTNLTNVNMRGRSFKGVILNKTILDGTGAVIPHFKSAPTPSKNVTLQEIISEKKESTILESDIETQNNEVLTYKEAKKKIRAINSKN